MRYVIEDGVEIPMRDGCKLRADIWLPSDQAGAWPVLLQRTPYRRQDDHGSKYMSALEFQEALRRGYAIVVQDTRGRFESEGDFWPFRHEAEDGEDTIAWLREQAFCDGRVGMFGASYVGATQVLAASRNPKGLDAISPQLTTARHKHSWTYRGGAHELGFTLLWILEALSPVDLERRTASLGEAKCQQLKQALDKLRENPANSYELLPILRDEIREIAPYFADWADAEEARTSKDDKEHLEGLLQSDAAMLVTAGWNDIFMEGGLELFRNAAKRTGGREKLIIGPWSHGNPKDWQGDFWHGYAASTALLSAAQLDFFDWIFGEGPEPARVRYFRTGSNSWHVSDVWPLADTKFDTWSLVDDGLIAGASEGQPRKYVADNLNPVPSCGGATFLPGLLVGTNSASKNQAEIEARDDVVCYTSAPLDQAKDVTGMVRLELEIETDAPSTDFTARLCEVTSDGQSFGLVDGILRLYAGGRQKIEIELGSISHLFAAGSRLRLQIASSNFPRFDRNPQSGVPAHLAKGEDFRIANQTIYGGVLKLPCVPADRDSIGDMLGGA